MTSMHFIGLDIHKKTISYCVKDVSGTVLSEGTVAGDQSSSRRVDEDVTGTVDRGDGSDDVHRVDL